MSVLSARPADPGRVAPLAETLLRDGYAVVRAAADPERIAAIAADLAPVFAATAFSEGRFYGERTKRFGRLLTRAPETAALVLDPLIRGTAERVLQPFCDRIQLNTLQAIEIHPGEPQQAPHRDDSMWRVPIDAMECLVNVMWPLTPFRPDNGGTLIWPRGAMLAGPLPDPADAVCPEMAPGDALIFLGSTVHCGGANRSKDPRAGLVVGYALGWLRQHENQYLAYPPAVAAGFTPALRDLIGYRIQRPNLGGHDGDCPSRLFAGGGRAIRPQSRDWLSAEHQAFVDYFHAAQAATSLRERPC